MLQKKTFKQRVVNNWFVKNIYKFKFHLDLGMKQVAWVTGKFPEIMAFLYLFDRFGVEISNSMLVVGGITIIFLFFIGGFYWHKLGLYEVEIVTNWMKNPISVESLTKIREIHKILNKK